MPPQAINIQISETIDGITTALTFAVSPEAYACEFGSLSDLEHTLYTLPELCEEQTQAICPEVRELVDQARIKLHLSLVSSSLALVKKKFLEESGCPNRQPATHRAG